MKTNRTRTKTSHKELVCREEKCYEVSADRGWGEGVWNTEPDRVDFKAYGLDCFIHRNRSGSWCGYVGVRRSHPLFGHPYDRPETLEVHGGLTYASKCGEHLCHIGGPRWWFGFDCAHATDYSPKMEADMNAIIPDRPTRLRDVGFFSHYWTMEKVTNETKQLAKQIARFTGHHLPPLPTNRYDKNRLKKSYLKRGLDRTFKQMRKDMSLLRKQRLAAGEPDYLKMVENMINPSVISD